MRLVRFAFIVLTSLAAPSFAQVVPTPQLPPTSGGVVDPRFAAIDTVLRLEGSSSPFFGAHGLGDATRTDGVSSLLRFRHRLSRAELDELEMSGVEWQRRGGEVVRVGSVYGAFTRFEALPALRAHPLLVLAEVAWYPVRLQPLESTGTTIGAVRSRRMPTMETAGAGALIGDIDSGVDVLHPHFFRADAGAFEWLDGDGDGKLSAGDFADLDRDGEGDFNEVLRILDGAEVGPDEGVRNDDGELDVARDWLYVDANGDGERNVGVAAGFTERSPAYGEPVFVPDDADRDGGLSPDERLLRLGSSKIERFVSTERTYVRGEDLIEAEDISFADQIFHGSGVSSILVGGHPGRDRSGIAPDADLIMYSSHIDAQGGGFEESGQFAALQDAVERGVDVVVHEWTNPTTAPIDGGGNFEEAMLAARAEGVVQVNPLGNLNRSQKHTEVEALAPGLVALDFNVGNGFDFGGAVYPYSSIYASIYWRADQRPAFTLRNPGGVAVSIPTDGTVVSIAGQNLLGTITRSIRGTNQLEVVVWNSDPDTSVVRGDWTIEADLVLPDRLVGRITDYWSGWSVGVKWLTPVVDKGTVVYPATADAAVGVAAFGGRHTMAFDESSPGELRNFSGRGPRIDGARVVDIAAPDDPFAAWGVSDAWLQAGVGRSWFRTFGGTSGAGPHVAGAVALMRASDPSASPAELEGRLSASASRDAFTPASLPDAAWGDGKLDIYAALFGEPSRPNEEPTVALIQDGSRLIAEVADADGDAVFVRWDLDYDGTWDTAWTDELTVSVPDVLGTVRVDVRDGRGGQSGAVLRLDEVVASMEPTMTDAGREPDVEFPTIAPELPPPCGCSSASEGAGSSLLFAGLFLAGRRRRK